MSDVTDVLSCDSNTNRYAAKNIINLCEIVLQVRGVYTGWGVYDESQSSRERLELIKLNRKVLYRFFNSY